MIGLLLKDYYSLRSYLFRQLGIICVIYVAVGFISKSFALLTPMMILLVLMSLISSIAIDDNSHWNSYALTLPVTLEQLILEKYVLFLGGIFSTSIVSCLLCVLLDSFTFREGAAEILFACAAVLAIYLLMGALSLPILLHFGAEKGRIYMILIFLLPFLLFSVGGSYLPTVFGNFETLPFPSGAQIALWGLIAALVCAIACVLSYCASLHLLRKKEY